MSKLLCKPVFPGPRRAFTLLELMLALGLTTVILLAVSMAIDLHLRAFDSRRRNLEESQLARAILSIIADDIRNAVQEYKQDVSGVQELMQASAGEAAQAVEDLTGVQLEGETTGEGEEMSAGEEEESTNTQNLSSTVTLPPRPGIYGNQYELQVDVSRLPRYDEYQQMMMANSTQGPIDIPSDIKTVTYYVVTSGTGTGTANAMSGGFGTAQNAAASTDLQVVGHGLVRRQLDRAVAQWALSNGGFSTADESAEVLAPEVVSLEFQYFDGSQWLFEWDTDANQSLPLAIRIGLLVSSSASPNVADATSAPESGDVRYYSLLVPIRIASQVTAEEESTTTESSSDSNTDSNSNAAATGGTGT